MRAVENPPRIKEVVTIMITTLTKMMLMLVMKEGKEKCRATHATERCRRNAFRIPKKKKPLIKICHILE